jgi:hypothetical protein
MPFSDDNFEEAEELGRKGGLVSSASKARAARQNGRKGGRPPSRTLAERLLGRKLQPWQEEMIDKALVKNEFMFVAHVKVLLDYFGVAYSTQYAFDTKVWRRKTARPPKEIRYLIAKFRLGAEYYLKTARPPKDYVVVTKLPTQEEWRRWEAMHDRFDFRYPAQPPPRRGKKYFRDLPQFHLLRRWFEKHPDMTARDIEEWGGGAYGGLGNAILAHLRSPLSPKDYFHIEFPPSSARRAKWELTHSPEEPCPGRRRRIYFKNLPDYDRIVRAFGKNPEMSEKELIAIGGDAYGYTVGSAVLRYLRSLAKT